MSDTKIEVRDVPTVEPPTVEPPTVEPHAVEPAVERPWWAPIAHFAAHTTVGTAIFVIIGIPAVALSFGVDWLGAHGFPPFPVMVLHFVEEALCVVDACLFLVYILVTSYHAFREFLQ
jgi:hypothetical protein